MTAEVECPHGLVEPSWCSTCTNGVERPPRSVGPSFAAKFDGWCTGCTDGVVRGQELVAMSDGSYRHVGCAR